VLATLFLSLLWYIEAHEFWFPGPPVVRFALLGGSALLLVALFYLGPAFAAQLTKRSLFDLVEVSLGSIPALGLRLCCVLYVVALLDGPSWLVARALSESFLHHAPSTTTLGLLAAGILAFLFATGLQSLRTVAKLAVFTNKLGIALLIAALLRVRGEWLAAFQDISGAREPADLPHIWRSFSHLFFLIGPPVFLASDFGRRSPTRKQAGMIGFFGLALPFAVTLLVVGFIEEAIGFVYPNLRARDGISTALWHGDSLRYIPVKTTIAAISMFGVVRFLARSLAGALSIFERRKLIRCSLLGLLVCTIALESIHYLDLSETFEWSIRSLVATAAVLSADFLAGRSGGSVRRLDWVGVSALLAGWGIPYAVGFLETGFFLVTGIDSVRLSSAEEWWLLPAYGVSFVICLLGRVAQRRFRVVSRAE
jgi:hypothetical protein